MVQKSGEHQLRLVVFPIIYKVLYIPGGCLGFVKHQQYDYLPKFMFLFWTRLNELVVHSCRGAIPSSLKKNIFINEKKGNLQNVNHSCHCILDGLVPKTTSKAASPFTGWALLTTMEAKTVKTWNFQRSFIPSLRWTLIITPPKTNIEPENHPFEKENHLPSTSILGFQPLVFRGGRTLWCVLGWRPSLRYKRLHTVDLVHSTADTLVPGAWNPPIMCFFLGANAPPPKPPHPKK